MDYKKYILLTIVLFCKLQFSFCQGVTVDCHVFVIIVNNDTLKLENLKYNDDVPLWRYPKYFHTVSYSGLDTFAVYMSQRPVCIEKNQIFVATELPNLEIVIIRNSIDTMKISFYDYDRRYYLSFLLDISFQKGIYKLDVAEICQERLDIATKIYKTLNITDREEINKIFDAVMRVFDFSEYEFTKYSFFADYAWNVTPYGWKQYLVK